MELKLSQEQQQMVIDNHNLIYSFLIKHKLDIEDWYGVASIGLCKSVTCWDKDKSSFSTFAYVIMLNYVRMEMRKQNSSTRKPKLEISSLNYVITGSDNDICEMSDIMPNKTNYEDEAIFNIHFNKFITKLKDKDKALVKLILENFTQKEIAQVVKLSQAQVSRRLSKIKKLIISEVA